MTTTNTIESLQRASLRLHVASQGTPNERAHGRSRIQPTAEPHSLDRILRVLAAIVLAATVLPQAFGQLCRVSYETVNKDRYVYGRINNECTGPHSKPFGNWGVDTESSNRVDGRQFEGWCRFRRACDRNGNCKWHCRDSWYEWNSCTYGAWAPPLVGFYNHNNHSQQRSTRGVNVHGTGTMSYSNGCPVDSDGDHINDRGGCVRPLGYRRNFTISGHRMALYELDGKGLTRYISTDSHVETLRYPTLSVPASVVSCTEADGCEPGVVGTWSGPSRPPASYRKTDAKAAIRIKRLEFSDEESLCCDPLVEECD